MKRKLVFGAAVAATLTFGSVASMVSADELDVELLLDETAPEILAETLPVVPTAEPGPGGVTAVVEYTLPTATDELDPAPVVTCDPVSGSAFAIGTTTVTCTAVDEAGNVSDPATFDVTVVDPEAPVFTFVPADIDTVTDSGLATAVVVYSPATAIDNSDPAPAVECLPASGSAFAFGTTTVTCTATDASGNSAQATFMVNVADVEPPEWTVSDIDEDATSIWGAELTHDADATDNVEIATETCDPVDAGILWHYDLGVTTVNCLAVDTSGNEATADFTVTVSVAAEGASIDILTDDIAGQEFDKPGTGTSLAAPLSSGAKLLDDDNESNDVAVCNKTEAFLKHVEKQAEKGRIGAEYADQLAEFTDGDHGLREALGC